MELYGAKLNQMELSGAKMVGKVASVGRGEGGGGWKGEWRGNGFGGDVGVEAAAQVGSG